MRVAVNTSVLRLPLHAHRARLEKGKVCQFGLAVRGAFEGLREPAVRLLEAAQPGRSSGAAKEDPSVQDFAGDCKKWQPGEPHP